MLEKYRIIKKNKKLSRYGRTVFHYIINSPDKWMNIENDICTSREHIDDHDVHPVTDQCSPDAIRDVQDIHTNNKKLTKRNNKEKKVLFDYSGFGTDDYENELVTSTLPLEDNNPQPAQRPKRDNIPKSMRFVEMIRNEIKTDDDRRKNNIATKDEVKKKVQEFKQNLVN